MLAVGGNYYLHRLADDLFGRVAKQPFGTLVPGQDNPIQIFAYDRILSRLDYRGELLS